jgi:glycosyltransferase involved in cell wall biosynthesis
MRIAFYSPRASHLEHTLAHGGDPILIDALFLALRERGHDVRVVSRLNVRDLWRGRVPARRFLREALRVRREMKEFRPQGWLVYNPSPPYPDLFGWWQRPRRYVLVGAHVWHSNRIPRRWRWLLELAFRQSLRRADHVIAARPTTATRLRAAGAPEKRLHVSPPGVRVEASIPSREEARRRLGLPDGATVVLTVGRFTREGVSEKKTESILALLDSFAGAPSGSLLVIVGDGPGRPRIERSIADLGLDERVRLIGAVRHEDLKWYFAACDVYAYPDLVDRSRLSILEAQACGRPVVTLRTESAELTVDAGRTGLLAGDLDEFRAQLAALLGDGARCEEMGQAAREYVTAFHSIDLRARSVEELLQ